MATTIRDYFAKAFRWQRGRQGTGDDKMLLLTAPWPIPFDSYLIRYPEGSEIPPHTDPVASGRHYRLNLILKSPRAGGEFDALQACAQFHSLVSASRPIFDSDHSLELIDGRHPLLDERLASARAEVFGEEPSDRKVVPVSVKLDRDRTALVVSGPNAGGQSRNT